MLNPTRGDGLRDDWDGIEEVDENDDVWGKGEPAGPVHEWEPIDEWLKRDTQKVVLGWFRQIALVIVVMTLLGVSGERVFVVGVVLLLPILETVALVLGLPFIASSSNLKKGRTSGSKDSGRRSRAPPKLK